NIWLNTYKTGGIAGFRLCLSTLGGCFHPPVETGGIEIGRIKKLNFFIFEPRYHRFSSKIPQLQTKNQALKTIL
ncbi:MAG TPA: hypothetical protein DIU00_00680, partial [Phycisphaerales bacterium]|nr:hypothetical protein [Phycisphaerales bacterium]